MFGFGASKFARMAKKGDFQKLGELSASPKAATRLAVVKALSEAENNTDAGATLVVFLRDPERSVQLAAIKAMGECGASSGTTHLNRMRTLAQQNGDKELEAAADDALHELRKRLGHE
jgi:hypothetical protein